MGRKMADEILEVRIFNYAIATLTRIKHIFLSNEVYK